MVLTKEPAIIDQVLRHQRSPDRKAAKGVVAEGLSRSGSSVTRKPRTENPGGGGTIPLLGLRD
jgi:hypothetical protein